MMEAAPLTMIVVGPATRTLSGQLFSLGKASFATEGMENHTTSFVINGKQ
ncbi:hypothetical protein GDO78_011766 [Eleutherodactylus coqui]|uniref:Uncharacterized protein n=1 Tax=Eleutherodactylus coqui TaxID=57060 RepID=A0A8J6K3V4_ELECQ|nr:hypothetical protein GDO78_011766 [Eleutherodactylus coqui]